MGIRVGLALEQGILREALSCLFRSAEDVQIVGEADDAAGAMGLGKQVEVLLISSKLSGMNLCELVRGIVGGVGSSNGNGGDLSRHPGVGENVGTGNVGESVRIIGVCGEIQLVSVREFLAAGGAGFISQSNPFAEFLRAIRAVLTKKIYLSPDVADAMVANYVLGPLEDRPVVSATALSGREREVLQLVAEGKSTKDAAAELKISAKTVDMHRQRIMNKLKIHSVAQLTKYAIREGLAALH